MLNEHVDIVVDDFPNELPPVGIIIHHIYLIPRASFPNKSTYRMTPNENDCVSRIDNHFYWGSTTTFSLGISHSNHFLD